MTRGYDERIQLVRTVPSSYIVPPNPDPYDPRLPAPPPGTGRHYLPTPTGYLELLYALPHHATLESPVDDTWKAPVLFLHGGFGSANCYSNFLPWFAARGHPAYSLSVRGHGRSWRPSYWALYFTSKKAFAEDLAAALKFIRERHPNAGPTALVGHSAGGGLSQYLIGQGKADGVGKLVILAGFPSFGGWQVYWNWFKLDPWFPIRVLWDLYHPRSPLSSTRLIHQAFFSPTYPADKVRTFEAEMAPYESMLWPSEMMFTFVSRTRVLANLLKSATSNHANASSSKKPTPLLVIAGAQDKLMSVPIMRRLAQMYAATNVGIGVKTTPGMKDVSVLQHEFTSGLPEEGKVKTDEGGIWFAEIEGPGAGHNLMRDDGWERCARTLEVFLDE